MFSSAYNRLTAELNSVQQHFSMQSLRLTSSTPTTLTVVTTLFSAITETLSATLYRPKLTYRQKLPTPHATHGHILTLLQHPPVTLIPSPSLSKHIGLMCGYFLSARTNLL